MQSAYKAMQWKPLGKTAVKVSTGEPPASNYLSPALIKDTVKLVNGTIVECNTAYKGARSNTDSHRQVAKKHGFTAIANVDIQDADGSITIPALKGGVLDGRNYVGKHFPNYDSYLVISHFKGHQMAGFGGAIKNISIGIGSAEGKCWIHSGGTSMTDPWHGEQDKFLEAMGEAGKAVSDYLGYGKNIAYVNVMNQISIDCDCNGQAAKPEMADIGILSSTDPVALDQACIDLVYAQKAGHAASLVKRIEDQHGLHTLEYAEKIGLGQRSYQLVNLDK